MFPFEIAVTTRWFSWIVVKMLRIWVKLNDIKQNRMDSGVFWLFIPNYYENGSTNIIIF